MKYTNAAKWQEQMDADAGRDAFREQVVMFKSFKIVTTLSDEGFVWEIFYQHPIYRGWCLWEESIDCYTSHEAAAEAARSVIDNYEPSQD